MTKIDIFSGFLGAGKTTLIKKLLEEVFADEKVVLIENEYGEVGIDGGFLKDAGIEITEMNSGCICCTLVGDFQKSLKEVMEKFSPDRIIIEPSGVGKLSDVMKSIKTTEDEFDVKLSGLITVVNAMKVSKQMKAFGEFFNNQIEFATTVVLSRSQKATDQQLELAVRQIQKLNPKAEIITTPWDEISGEQILSVIEKQKSLEEEVMAEALEAARKDQEEHDREHHHDHEHEHEHHHDHEHEHDHHHDHDHDHEHHHHHHADDIFTSWGRETPHKYSKDKIESILKTFADSEDYGVILRAKGMVPSTDGGWIYFDMVPGEYELRDGEPEYTGRLCVIGTDLKEDEIEKLFEL